MTVTRPLVYSEEHIASEARDGWELLDTTFDLNYKGHWTTWHAVRELVQNALDEHDDAGIPGAPSIARTAASLTIKDSGRGLGAQGLLMRETKSGVADLRGRFGEGLKLACIVFLREGYSVQISSPHFVIRPIVRQRVIGGQGFQLVSFLFKNQPGTSTGTQITIEGYQGPDYKDRFWPMLSAQKVSLGYVTIGRFKRPLDMTTSPANRLYVGDIYVRELGTEGKTSPYSYSVWGLSLNPDRDAEVQAFQLWRLVADAWRYAPRDLIVALIKQVTADKGWEANLAWDYSSVSGVEEKYQAKWKAAWQEAFGAGAVIYTNDEWARYAQAYGYSVVRLPHAFGNYLAGVIPFDKDSVISRVGTTGAWRKELADSDLSPHELQNLKKARFFTDQLLQSAGGYGDSAPIKVVAAEFSKDPSTGTTVQGLWQGSERTVSLGRPALGDFRSTIETLLHELGHWASGADDLTAEHASGIAFVAFKALEIQKSLAGVTTEATTRAPERAPVGVAAGPIRQVVKEMGWTDLAARARAAGIPNPEHWSKATLRKMLNL